MIKLKIDKVVAYLVPVCKKKKIEYDRGMWHNDYLQKVQHSDTESGPLNLTWKNLGIK